jgi:hypothetical protein
MELLHSVTEFFHEEVKEALRGQRVDADPTTEFYIVNLLVEFTTTPATDDPLGVKLAEAQTQLPEARTKCLKLIGDTSLYMSGFFADALARKLVDVDYYMSIGGTAYRQLAGTQPVNQMAPVYRELAARFADFVAVLGDIRQRSSFAGGGNLIKLYEEWRRTGSEVLERRLRELGMLSLDAVNGNQS